MTSLIRPLWDWDKMPLQPLWSTSGESVRPAVSMDENPFTDIFRSAVDAVKETDAEKTELQYLMSTGQLDNPVPLLLASSKAELSVSLLLQLRSRAMDAYNELMRINL